MFASALLASAIAFIGYTYVGYPFLCLVRARLSPRPIQRAPIRPRVSVVVAAFREVTTIASKLATLAAQSYPAALLEVVVVCDGSDDGTPDVAQQEGSRILGDRLRVVVLPTRSGKPSALNAGAAVARGEILLFTDARQALSTDAVQLLVEDLADPSLGAVGGELVLGGDAPAGAYWRYEAFIRRLEGLAGSTVGVSGALYAIRRSLFADLPAETILDDVLVPMRVRLAGLRVGFEPAAKAYDQAAPSAREFQRKVRTLSGNFQLLAMAPALLLPWRNPSWFELVSHKLLRLCVPYALLAILAASFALPPPWRLVWLALQLGGYGLAAGRAAKLFRRSRLAGLAETFVVLNAAAMGLARFLRHGRRLPW